MNNFKSIGTSSISASAATPTTIYTANNGAPVNSVLLQADVANTGAARMTVTLLFVDSDNPIDVFSVLLYEVRKIRSA